MQAIHPARVLSIPDRLDTSRPLRCFERLEARRAQRLEGSHRKSTWEIDSCMADGRWPQMTSPLREARLCRLNIELAPSHSLLWLMNRSAVPSHSWSVD